MGRSSATAGIPVIDRIELWPIEKLKPYERNPRTHSPQQIADLVASIVEFGFTQPIVVGRGKIRAGHGRLVAARRLGLAKLPVIVRDDLTEIQLRAYLLADNRLAQDAGWDAKLLLEEIADLKAEAYDVNVTGFTDEELRGYQRELEAPADEGRTAGRAGKILYMLEFDNEDQKARWYEFLAWLNARRGSASLPAAITAITDKAIRGREKKA